MQLCQENGDGTSDDDLSLPDNEDTILDQDPDKTPPNVSSATQSPPQAATRLLKRRFRNRQPVSMPLNKPLVEEEPSLKSREDVSTSKPLSAEKFADKNDSQLLVGSDLSSQSTNRRLRSKREIALISMAGRDGGGSYSGAGSSGSETNGTEEEEEDEEEEEKEKKEKEKEKEKEKRSIQAEPFGEAEEGSEDEDEEEEEAVFLTPASLLHHSTATTTHPTKPTFSSLTLALHGNLNHIPLSHSLPHCKSATVTASPDHDRQTFSPQLSPSPISFSTRPISLDRAMADALGDQSDAEVTEDDEEMGIKRRQRGEEARILEVERRERGAGRGKSDGKVGVGNGTGAGNAAAVESGTGRKE